MSEFRPLWEGAKERFDALRWGARPGAGPAGPGPREGTETGGPAGQGESDAFGFEPLAWAATGERSDREAGHGEHPGAQATCAPPGETAEAQAREARQPDPKTAPEAQAAGQAELDVALLMLRREAFEAGRREGLEAGRLEAEERLARIEDLARQLDGARQEVFASSVQDVAAAVLHIARRVVGRELRVSQAGIEDLVRGILADVRSGDEVVVRLAEPDARMMRDAWPSLLELVGRDGELHLEVDQRLQPGGAIVETRHGRIDASVEARFAAFEQSVEAWARHELEAIDD